jgi:uncharacterized protein (DUF2267 family)
MIRSVDSVERSVHKTNEWLGNIETELEIDDREYAWRVLTRYLQLLRDRLTVSEAAQFAAQLTIVIRGSYYEGFDPDNQPEKLRGRDEFLAEYAERAQLEDIEEAERCAHAVARVIERHVTPGELDDVMSQLPRGLREVVSG